MNKGQKGFTKGDSDAGTPKGQQSNFTKNKAWRDAIRRAVLAGDGKKLRGLAEALIAKALAGDVAAIREIGDCLDGKAIQQVDASVEATITVSSTDAQL